MFEYKSFLRVENMFENINVFMTKFFLDWRKPSNIGAPHCRSMYSSWSPDWSRDAGVMVKNYVSILIHVI